MANAGWRADVLVDGFFEPQIAQNPEFWERDAPGTAWSETLQLRGRGVVGDGEMVFRGASRGSPGGDHEG
jgi:hypothetical protein